METHTSHLLSSPLGEVLDQGLVMLLAFRVSVSLQVGAKPIAFVAYRDKFEIPIFE